MIHRGNQHLTDHDRITRIICTRSWKREEKEEGVVDKGIGRWYKCESRTRGVEMDGSAKMFTDRNRRVCSNHIPSDKGAMNHGVPGTLALQRLDKVRSLSGR